MSKISTQTLKDSWLPDWWYKLQMDREEGRARPFEDSYKEYMGKTEQERLDYLNS